MKKKFTHLQITILSMVTIVLNAIIFYYINCTGGVLESKDVFGTQYTYKMNDIVLQRDIINSMPSDMIEAELFLREKIGELSAEYENNPQYATSEEAFLALQEAKRPYEAVLSQLSYMKGYPDYVLGITDNASSLLQLPIYQQEGWLRNNIIRTQKDFYGLEQITLTPEVEAGYIKLLNYRITDFLAVLLTFGYVWILAVSKKQFPGKSLGVPICVWLLSLCAMYLLNIGMTSTYIGLPDFHVTLQSLPSFQRCPYLISCGVLVAICSFFKLVGMSVLFCIGMFCFSSHKKFPSVIIAGILGIQLWLAFREGEAGLTVFLREINLFSTFSAERFFLRYLNLDIGGLAVSALILFALFMVLVLVTVIFSTVRRVSNYSREYQESVERAYYDELDHRYEETRKIRHDINNHLLALKLLIEREDLTSVKTYLGEISEELDQTIMPVRTGSNVLDALIWQKIRQAHTHKIDIQVEMHCSVNNRTISDYDLCGIFGNIMDNAMEAVEGMANPKIHLSVRNQLNMLYISCDNPYQGERKKRGEKFFSTKDTPEHHGIGIARVKEISKKYNGEVNISTDKEIFLIEILLNSK